MNLSVQYRGPLTSCNYQCKYCPFAKRQETPAQLDRDKESLARFTAWMVSQSEHRWRVLFTPWGEALVRSWYRRAMVDLSHCEQVQSVAVQTNLSCDMQWLGQCRPQAVALWATYHPTEVTRARFVAKVRKLSEQGIRLSVGAVGVPEHLSELAALRAELPADVYLWINAQQPRKRPYSAEEIAAITTIDPHFPLTARRQRSAGRACRTGETAFTVDGQGDMRRCHFVDEVIGNIYDGCWEQALQARVCPRQWCDCFLGKSQLLADPLEPVFATGLLERIPSSMKSKN